ncbi:hypothetical protein [Streptomyces sp. NPDC002671]
MSSIVNTSEVLPILRAAGIAGQPVRLALDFLAAPFRSTVGPATRAAGVSTPGSSPSA